MPKCNIFSFNAMDLMYCANLGLSGRQSLHFSAIYDVAELGRGSILETTVNPMDKMPRNTKSKADTNAARRKQLEKYKLFFEKHRNKYSDDDIDLIRKCFIS